MSTQAGMSVFNFRPKDSELPPDIFDVLRALPCKLNKDNPKWNPKRLSLALAIGGRLLFWILLAFKPFPFDL